LTRTSNPPITALSQIVFEREADGHLRHLSISRKGEVTLLLVPGDGTLSATLHLNETSGHF
jgi:hypothetical protein